MPKNDMDNFKQQVYDEIGTLEMFDRESKYEVMPDSKGCLGAIFSIGLGRLAKYSIQKGRDLRKIDAVEQEAKRIVGESKVKDLLCGLLTPEHRLPIDIASVIVPALYEFADSRIYPVRRDVFLFAAICRELSKRSEDYCA